MYTLAKHLFDRHGEVSLSFAVVLSLAWASWGAAQGPEPKAWTSFSLNKNERVVLIGNGYFEREAEYSYLETMLTSRYHGSSITFRNIGWAGDTVNVRLRPRRFLTVQQSAKDQHPDIVLVAYGMNEAFYGEAGLEPFREGYENFLESLERATGSRAVLLSPTQHFVLESPVPNAEKLNSIAGLYAEAVRGVAESRAVPFVNLYDSVSLPDSVDLKLSTNGIHLTKLGYWLAGIAFERQLELVEPTWSVEVRGTNIDSSGTTISEFNVRDNGLSFVARDSRLPLPVPPVSTSASENEVHRIAGGDWGIRRLQFIGLAPGTYALRIDGSLVISASAAAWARGILISSGPEFDQVEAMRRLIVEKNRLFFYIWRSHNAEFSIGSRSSEDGESEEAPFEYKGHFKEDNETLEGMILECEEAIATLAMPVQHQYVLSHQGTE